MKSTTVINQTIVLNQRAKLSRLIVSSQFKLASAQSSEALPKLSITQNLSEGESKDEETSTAKVANLH